MQNESYWVNNLMIQTFMQNSISLPASLPPGGREERGGGLGGGGRLGKPFLVPFPPDF